MIDLKGREEWYEEGLGPVKQYLSTLDGKGIAKRHRLQAKAFFLSDGVVFCSTKNGPRLVLQIEARVGVLRAAHDLVGHWDRRTTTQFVDGAFGGLEWQGT